VESTKHSKGERPFRVAISPLSWTNDVLEDLGGDIPLEQCLAEAQAAGFDGTELGRKFPRSPEVLGPLLDRYQLKLASGWYSGFLTERDVATEMQAVAQHAKLLATLGARVMVYGECGKMVPDTPLDAAMSYRVKLEPDDFAPYADRLTEFTRRLDGEFGLTLAYHHHLMMVAETFDEISRLFDHTGRAVGLVLDTGHAAAAGFDYTRLIDRFGDRIVHLHLKDVRADVMRAVRDGDLSFNEGVRAGMFTIPGDGSVDFSGLADFVRKTGYAGWLVVEAEQDPVKAPPLETVSRARRFIASLF
jgi:inosose dehydratase